MTKAYEIMTQGLITCSPDTNVAEVTDIMRSYDIGNVLVVEDGKLRGIVTDRDLAVQALTGRYDPLETPVRKFMTRHVLTGKTSWDLKKVARKMAKHQIRRLPILHSRKLVGIISLGDLARNENRRGVVKKSLEEISEPNGNSAARSLIPKSTFVGLSLAALAAVSAMIALRRSWRPLPEYK